MKAFIPSLLALALLAAPASAQMPDVSQMSGAPLPAADLPDRTISVRVVRGGLEQNMAGQPVELHAGHAAGQTFHAVTDDSGRAQFAEVPAGRVVHVVTTVDGQQIQSKDFPVPDSGGVRVILVAPGGAGAAAGATPMPPAEPGTVSLGGQSRFVIELTEDALEVYYLLEVVNAERAPIATEPLVFELPAGARNTTILEGSSPLATAEGARVTVTGPFPPGRTIVNVAYQLPYESGRHAFAQRLPAALGHTSVVVRKLGAMAFHSPQVQSQREMPVEGQTYVAGSGPGLPAGSTIEFEVTGLPHHASWPRMMALALAAFVLGMGAWLAVAPGQGAAARVHQLEARRDQLLGELVTLEAQHAQGRVDEVRYASRREDLVTHLERVYHDLDETGEPPSPEAAGQPTEPLARPRVRAAH
jgi:hypothetical protein